MSLVSHQEGNVLAAGVHASRPSHNVSANGRFVVFATKAYDDGVVAHSYVRDLQTGDLLQVDAPSSAAAFANGSDIPVISENGERVLFASQTPIEEGSSMLRMQVWQRDIVSGELQEPRMLTVNAAGVIGSDDSCYDYRTSKFWPGLAISADGTTLGLGTFASNLGEAEDLTDTLVYTRGVESTTNFQRVSETVDGVHATDRSYGPVLSALGERVAFVSRAYNLPGGASTPLIFKVYWREAGDDSQSIRSVSLGRDTDGSPTRNDGPALAPAISSHGNHVSFASSASNLEVNVERGDLSEYSIYLASNIESSTNIVPRFIASTGIAASEVNSDASPATHELRSSVSGDGRFVAFASRCTLADIEAEVTPCSPPSGAYAQIFVFDESLSRFEQLTFGTDGDSHAPSMTPNGNVISFVSDATDVMPGVDDHNDGPDIFALRWDN